MIHRAHTTRTPHITVLTVHFPGEPGLAGYPIDGNIQTSIRGSAILASVRPAECVGDKVDGADASTRACCQGGEWLSVLPRTDVVQLSVQRRIYGGSESCAKRFLCHVYTLHVARIQVISTVAHCRRLHVSCVGDKIVVTATCIHFYPRAEHCLELVSVDI